MAKIVKVMHSDPGHAWLAVKLSEIEMLGIKADISSYCDAGKFIEAMRVKGIEVEVKEGACRDRSPIRYFKPYSPDIV